MVDLLVIFCLLIGNVVGWLLGLLVVWQWWVSWLLRNCWLLLKAVSLLVVVGWLVVFDWLVGCNWYSLAGSCWLVG